MDDTIFFRMVRESVFGGHLTPSQFDGINHILDYQEQNYPALLKSQFAAILGNCTWETGREMQPISEKGGPRYLRSKTYWPWIGEGLIQVTWQQNAMKFGAKEPGDLLQWPIALDALFRGCLAGMFTGKKISDFVNSTKTDFFNCREVVNGLDRAHEVAALCVSYYKALEAASTSPAS